MTPCRLFAALGFWEYVHLVEVPVHVAIVRQVHREGESQSPGPVWEHLNLLKEIKLPDELVLITIVVDSELAFNLVSEELSGRWVALERVEDNEAIGHLINTDLSELWPCQP